MSTAKTDIPSNANTTSDTIANTTLAWSIPLEISTDEATYLDKSQVNSPEELSIPREVISEVVGSSRLVAELERPIKIGTFNELPAFLLRTRFAFQRASSNWLYRIQAAEITIVFEDAQMNMASLETKKKKALQHPAIAAFYPEQFEGEISQALVTEGGSVSLDAGYMGVGASVGVETSRTYVEQGRVVVHGVRGGGRNRNSITWMVEQNAVQRSGIPRDIRLPLIVTRAGSGRFSARVTVKAHYGFWRGPLARSIPVIGKNDEPLYFDPSKLESMVDAKERGPYGTLIAESCGVLNEVDLESLSSFPKTI